MLLLFTAPNISGCVSEHGRSIPLADIVRNEAQVFIGLGNHTHGPQTAIRGDRLIRGLPVRQRLEIHGLMAADRCIEATLGYAPLKWHPLPASD